MKRTLEIIPTVILLLMFIFSLYLRLNQEQWTNLFVVSLTGLSLYSFVIIMVDGISNHMIYERPQKLESKVFYTFQTIIWILSTGLAIYLMAHN